MAIAVSLDTEAAVTDNWSESGIGDTDCMVVVGASSLLDRIVVASTGYSYGAAEDNRCCSNMVIVDSDSGPSSVKGL